MSQWWKDLKRLLIWGGAIFGILMTIFIINQFWTLYQFMAQLHPILASVVITILVIGLAFIGYKVTRQLFRNQPVLELPANPSEEEHAAYLDSWLNILAKNPHLEATQYQLAAEDKEITLDADSKAALINEGLATLRERSLPVIKENANAIFLSTAISQNGSLDSFMVLFTLMRMVWQLAKFYETRPSLVSLLKLYLQVASVVLMARTLEDADLIEDQMEPLIATIIGESLASAIPGMVPVTNLIVSSLMEGTVNAFLTLRVGLITQNYLGTAHSLEKSSLRRATSTQALRYMGSIIKSNSSVVLKTVGNAAKNASIGKAKRWLKLDKTTDKL